MELKCRIKVWGNCFQKEFKEHELRDGSVDKVLALLTQGPKSNPQNTLKSRVWWHTL